MTKDKILILKNYFTEGEWQRGRMTESITVIPNNTFIYEKLVIHQNTYYDIPSELLIVFIFSVVFVLVLGMIGLQLTLFLDLFLYFQVKIDQFMYNVENKLLTCNK